MDAKPLLKSKTVLFNGLFIALAWLARLALAAVEAGDVPPEFDRWSLLILAVGNLILRAVTREPLDLSALLRRTPDEEEPPQRIGF